MSPASRSKSKDKRAAAVKEPPKASVKPTSNINTTGAPTSGYNPLLGTFHTLDTAPVSSAPPLHINGRFRNIEETDDHSGNSIGTGVEYDSVSNNGSWSGESEDPKDKTSQPTSRLEATIPGADSDKREKIRQKNEKKHQRQKERRAQELHERCSGYLMSRKLEALAQQLVAMGFSSERATMALILNEGRVEESVAWLFEGGEEAADNNNNQREQPKLDTGAHLKIDISEELARIADMEIKFKCSKQEVERAIVACEGDLEQAAETLRVQKQEPPSVTPKLDDSGDPPTSSKLSVSTLSQNSNSLRQSQQQKPTTTPSTQTAVAIQQQRRDEKDFNYTKIAVGADPGSKNMQLLKKIQPKIEWAKQQQQQQVAAAIPSAGEKRWPVAGGPNPSVSYSLTSAPLQVSPPSKTETRFASVGNELKNIQLGSVREPFIMMQRPQSKQMQMQLPTTSISSSSPASGADWQPNGMETVLKPNGLSHIIPTSTTTRASFSPPSYESNNSINHSNQLYEQFHYQGQPPQAPHQYVSSQGTSQGNGSNGLWNRMMGGNTSPTLAAASSLGLFSGLGSNGPSGPSSPVDWNAGGSMLHLDYTNIDWSLDRAQQSSSRPSGMWQGVSSSMQQNIGTNTSVKTAMRHVLSNNGVVSIAGLHDGVAVAGSETSSGAGSSREWTSPFEEKDLFSLPRQFVSSPSL